MRTNDAKACVRQNGAHDAHDLARGGGERFLLFAARDRGMATSGTAPSTIWQAARAGDVDRVRTLLSKGGIDVNQADPYGFSPLHWAAQKGNVEIVQLLLDHGANIDSRDV